MSRGPLSRYSTQRVTAEDIAAVVHALSSPWLTGGPVLDRFETEVAHFVGARYCVAVASGTAALQLAYRASGAALVCVPALSFVATASAARMNGQSVSFRDVDPVTGLCDGPGHVIPVGIYAPVHYAGRAATLDQQNKATWIIEDAAHAFGARDFDDCSRVGSCKHSLATCFSFHPVKPLTTGEGGAITTNDRDLADELCMLRDHGRDDDGLCQKLGYNYRMDEMSAALGLAQLDHVEADRLRRLEIAEQYERALMWGETIEHPPVHPGSAHHLFPIRVKRGRRDQVRRYLLGQGIGVQVHYKPINEQPLFAQEHQFFFEKTPEAHAWGQEELSLPCHAGMTRADVATVIEALNQALAEAA